MKFLFYLGMFSITIMGASARCAKFQGFNSSAYRLAKIAVIGNLKKIDDNKFILKVSKSWKKNVDNVTIIQSVPPKRIHHYLKDGDRIFIMSTVDNNISISDCAVTLSRIENQKMENEINERLNSYSIKYEK